MTAGWDTCRLHAANRCSRDHSCYVPPTRKPMAMPTIIQPWSWPSAPVLPSCPTTSVMNEFKVRMYPLGPMRQSGVILKLKKIQWAAGGTVSLLINCRKAIPPVQSTLTSNDSNDLASLDDPDAGVTSHRYTDILNSKTDSRPEDLNP